MIDQYLDELEAELRHAAGRRTRLAVARVPHPPAGAFAGVCGVAACLLVALVLLQAGRTRPAGSGLSAGSSGSLAPVPGGARSLVGELGVFRRPQTAADRIDSPIPHLFVLESVPEAPPGTGAQNLKVIPSLTRLVARMPGGRRIYLAIGRVAGNDASALQPPPGFKSRGLSPAKYRDIHPKAPAPHYDVVWLEVPIARSRLAPLESGQSMLASPALTASALLKHGQTASPPEGIPDDPTTLIGQIQGPKTWLAIVPDGVVRARWTIQYPGRRQRVAVTLPVSKNVALLHVANGQKDEVWSLTWLAANGRALNTLSYPSAFQ
jgi:hypothetical protein